MAQAEHTRELRIIPVSLRDEIKPGDSLPEKLLQALRHLKLSLKKGDILVVKHKIVSKAEGQLVQLNKIKPSAASRAWARRYHLDARVTEVALGHFVANSDPQGGDHVVETKPLLAFARCYVTAHLALDLIDEEQAEAILNYCEEHLEE